MTAPGSRFRFWVSSCSPEVVDSGQCGRVCECGIGVKPKTRREPARGQTRISAASRRRRCEARTLVDVNELWWRNARSKSRFQPEQTTTVAAMEQLFPRRTNVALTEEFCATRCREAHACWKLSRHRRDPIELLVESNKGRLPELVPIRFGRMLRLPFTRYRGSAAVIAVDLATTAIGAQGRNVNRQRSAWAIQTPPEQQWRS